MAAAAGWGGLWEREWQKSLEHRPATAFLDYLHLQLMRSSAAAAGGMFAVLIAEGGMREEHHDRSARARRDVLLRAIEHMSIVYARQI